MRDNHRLRRQDSFYRVNDRHVEFVLKKRTSKVWPRLLESSEKPGWLKVDFDKLGDSSEDTDNDESIDDWQRASQLADYLRKGRFETDPGVKKTRSESLTLKLVILRCSKSILQCHPRTSERCIFFSTIYSR